MQVQVWSDVVCPWCLIGKRRLETALEKFPHRDQVEVIWRSFQLDLSVPEGETHATLPALAAKYGRSVEAMRANMARVEQVAAGEGLDYHLADGVNNVPGHDS
jgi:predicted DsbA family dithiol-disulfide isomerase